MIKIRNLTVEINKKEVLKDINYEFKKGHITTIIGPNGCGKSTLLKSILLLTKFKRGSIYLCNKDIHKYKRNDIARLMTMMFQQHEISETFTVEELISFGRIPYSGFMKSLNKNDYEKIETAMKDTEVIHLRDKLLKNLSGGEKQRVFLATCLCQEPQILLLDEPTNHLDIKFQLELLNLIKQLNLKNKLTVVAVLHDLNLALKFSDEIIILKNGEIYSYGNPKEVITEKNIYEVFDVKCSIENSREQTFLKFI